MAQRLDPHPPIARRLALFPNVAGASARPNREGIVQLPPLTSRGRSRLWRFTRGRVRGHCLSLVASCQTFGPRGDLVPRCRWSVLALACVGWAAEAASILAVWGADRPRQGYLGVRGPIPQRLPPSGSQRESCASRPVDRYALADRPQLRSWQKPPMLRACKGHKPTKVRDVGLITSEATASTSPD